MNCWHCNNELIWGGDHDMEDDEDYDIVTNLSCPKCHTHVDVYHPSERLIKEYEDYDKKSKRNKKERTTSEKLQEELEPITPCSMSDE
jgi:hypothetical protein